MFILYFQFWKLSSGNEQALYQFIGFLITFAIAAVGGIIRNHFKLEQLNMFSNTWSYVYIPMISKWAYYQIAIRRQNGTRRVFRRC